MCVCHPVSLSPFHLSHVHRPIYFLVIQQAAHIIKMEILCTVISLTNRFSGSEHIMEQFKILYANIELMNNI